MIAGLLCLRTGWDAGDRLEIDMGRLTGRLDWAGVAVGGV